MLNLISICNVMNNPEIIIIIFFLFNWTGFEFKMQINHVYFQFVIWTPFSELKMQHDEAGRLKKYHLNTKKLFFFFFFLQNCLIKMVKFDETDCMCAI